MYICSEIILFFFAIALPRITKRSKDKVTVVEGNPLYLVCKAEGYPKPRVTWRKNGKLIQNITNETNFVIHDASREDAGNYECEASNLAGTVSYKVEVTIKGDGNSVPGKDNKQLTPAEVGGLIVGIVLFVALVITTIAWLYWKTKRRPRGSYSQCDYNNQANSV